MKAVYEDVKTEGFARVRKKSRDGAINAEGRFDDRLPRRKFKGLPAWAEVSRSIDQTSNIRRIYEYAPAEPRLPGHVVLCLGKLMGWSTDRKGKREIRFDSSALSPLTS